MPQQKGFKRAQKVARRNSKIAVRKKAANIRRTERRKTAAEKEEKADK
jgi:hypothetical protein